MIRSMTGFGRAAFEVDQVAFEIELRCVNHRYFDLRTRLPRMLAGFEPDLRACVQERFARGKVDAVVQIAPTGGSTQRIQIDLQVVEEYLRAGERLKQQYGVSGDLDLDDLLALPGVARQVETELPERALKQALLDGAARAVEAADAMRTAEGASLERELLGRLDAIVAIAAELEGRADLIQQRVREKLRKRSEQLAQETGLLDDARLHQEIVLAADRLDITEEIVRLRSHVEQFRSAAGEAGPGRPVGRRLDFLLQEMGREVNTIGSKGGDAPVAHLVVDVKTELERIREQVQNVE